MDTGELLYARLSSRLRAMTIDLVVVSVTVVGLMIFGSAVPLLQEGRGLGLTVVLFVLLYEPVTVACWGGTLGHRRANLRVERLADGKNLGLPRAIVRWAAKAFLGIFSLASMAVSRRAQTLHDILTASVVVAANPEQASNSSFVKESDPTPIEGGLTIRAPGWRQAAITTLYLPIPFVLGIVPPAVLSSQACLIEDVCTPDENLWWTVGTWIWIGSTVLVLLRGWSGKLPGTRGSRT